MIRSCQLTYRYANGPTLAFADLHVVQGGVLVLGGASGSGKSTWLALAAGLLQASSGDLTVAGQNLKDLDKLHSDAWRAKTIGFLAVGALEKSQPSSPSWALMVAQAKQPLRRAGVKPGR